MSSFINNVASIPRDVVEYVNLQKELVKVQIAEKSANLISKVLTYVVLAFLGVFALILLSIGVAMSLNELFNNSYAGFYTAAGFYALIGLILYFARKSLITDRIADITTNILMDDE
jgi:uncharacterized membrane protein YqjE